jgi:hemolysin III
MDPSVISVLGLRHPVSAGSHLLGALLGAFVAAMLWRLSRGERLKQLSLGVYGLCLVLLYAASGTYHAILYRDADTLELFRNFDHSAIYLLIAGTFTPVYAVLLAGRLRWLMLAAVWALALAGIAAKWLLPHGPFVVSVVLYVSMGVVGLAPIVPLIRSAGLRAMLWGLGGAAVYTAGGVCEACDWPLLLEGVIRPHEVFHLMDLTATAIHVVFFVRFVLPFKEDSPQRHRGHRGKKHRENWKRDKKKALARFP